MNSKAKKSKLRPPKVSEAGMLAAFLGKKPVDKQMRLGIGSKSKASSVSGGVGAGRGEVVVIDEDEDDGDEEMIEAHEDEICVLGGSEGGDDESHESASLGSAAASASRAGALKGVAPASSAASSAAWAGVLQRGAASAASSLAGAHKKGAAPAAAAARSAAPSPSGIWPKELRPIVCSTLRCAPLR